MSPQRKILLGVDVGSTKTRALLTDENGTLLGFGLAGPGNHEAVGYPGLTEAVHAAVEKACEQAGTAAPEICAAGLGISGLDWDSQEMETRRSIENAGIRCPSRLVNDTILGLVAGASEGWGIAVVSGTGCNCWGWNQEHSRIGRVTGGGMYMGEGVGATELMYEAVKAVARSWTKRKPATTLADAFVESAGARDLSDLLQGLMENRYALDARSAPLVFQAAAEGDPAAVRLVEWAATELGEMVNAVVRQLDFQEVEFDLVAMGSMFDAGQALVDPMRRTVAALAPRARCIRLACPPVVGAVILAMEQAGLPVPAGIRERIIRETITRMNPATTGLSPK